jgi:uncharacterized SAM-binding protein YcdF (DUF218 family)
MAPMARALMVAAPSVIIIAMTYIQPLLFLFLLIAVIGVVRLRHNKSSRLPIVGILGLVLLSWPPVDWLLSRPLEARYSIRPYPSAPAQAIVVLSSAVSPPIFERPYGLPDEGTYRRCEFAAWLHKHWKPLPVIACGGQGAGGGRAFSLTMRELLQRAGVPDAMIWTEERSHSTHENAVFGSEILRKNGIVKIVLVVEARSMLRAEACFRKEGMVVIPAPCEFREIESPVRELIPSWRAIMGNESTLHEEVGLAWYWLRGWI